jgi:hypothetical protein
VRPAADAAGAIFREHPSAPSWVLPARGELATWRSKNVSPQQPAQISTSHSDIRLLTVSAGVGEFMFGLPFRMGGLASFGLIAILQVSGSAPAAAQAAPSAPSACRITPVPQADRPATTPLPRAVCERTPSCARAHAEWVEAFKTREDAYRRLAQKRRQLFDAELAKPAVQEAVAALQRTRSGLKPLKDAVGSVADTTALKLSSEIEAARQQPSDATRAAVFATARGDLDQGSFMAEDATKAKALLDFVESARAGASATLAALAGLAAAATSDALVQLEQEEKEAATCLKEAEVNAGLAGANVTVTALDPPSIGSNTLRIVSATFGELRGSARCDAFTRVRLDCEFIAKWYWIQDGREASTTEATTAANRPYLELRLGPVDRPYCQLSSSDKLCGGGDGPGLLGKQQVRIAWTCGSSAQRFCRTWNAGETVTMMCDGTDRYIEHPGNKCR